MRSIKLQIQTKIALLIILVIFISIVNTAIIITPWRMNDIRNDIEKNNMNIAKIIANTPLVKENLAVRKIGGETQKYVEYILSNTNGIDVIVVADMLGIRHAHPNPERIGERFVGGDERRVIASGETYISESEGTLGKQIRAFVPVLNSEGVQVGFVMVSQLLGSVGKIETQALLIVIVSSFGGLFIGIIGAFIISRNIKKSLLGYEPEQISKLYMEKKEILEAMQEGIIAIDINSKVTLINQAALKILKLENTELTEEVIGRNINDIVPNCRLTEVIISGKEEKFKEQLINDTVVVINRVPVKDGQRVVGAIATFNDKTMVAKLAEEITGIKQIVEALRANNHEFQNKLHLILGFIHLNRLNEAKEYIVREADKQQHLLSFIMNRINDSTVAALLLGKISRAKELAISMKVEENSYLNKLTGRITSSSMVTIIGNLLENAMEELSNCNKDNKDISVLIQENDQNIHIVVEDNGSGINQKDRNSIFNLGYSTKEGNRGRGLTLIKEIIDNLKGNIEFKTKENEGTVFTVIIPKEVF